MARTVGQGFDELVERVTPKYVESENAARNLTKIERLLSAEFGMDYLATFGSSGHGTNVAGYSAVDCFAVIHKSRLHEKSGQSLHLIKDCLSEHFDDVTVTRGRPVVSVPFGGSGAERHQIVPAFLTKKIGHHDVYAIPGPSNRWVGSCPGLHSAWINQLNDNLNKSFKPFTRVVKAWNCYNGEPIWSFYLELCAADYLQKDGGVVYSMDVKNFLRHMVDLKLEPLPGSKGCSEPVYGTAAADRERALEALEAAADLAQQARDLEVNGDIVDAFYHWRMLFNWNFPPF